ncbi:serine/threonine protein kinase [Scytonema hofmannii FACHB-248]|uniref:non-specific serine/threonine protein kinase n=1 Tax=Scytonema hofmannii FACHB-248 TaxID=1842502 RepID=A0ABR8GU32_9CYAN|nr:MULTISPECIES: serine/threonine-protein kinase [Nostocales]MBD2607009.1 serine/threonine protein kinase [Scytonema hofmannii FACHB-248]
MKETFLSDRYRIINMLGSGGFCETFLAEDTQMPSGRTCVIKQLKPINNDPHIHQLVQKRFQREAAILEELGGVSKQIPTLYAYFQEDNQFYLVQEWISGQTLSQKVKQSGCLRESEVRSILISLLEVLEYVHSKGIIHRDIKPDNIILRSSDNKPVLIDFGAVRETMATVVNSEGNISSSMVVGTTGFMPNEQAAGRPVFASDLYTLGLTTIYLLTGKTPEQLATDSYTSENIWDREIVSPSFAGVLDKAIRFDVRERFHSAKAMLNALENITNSLPQKTPIFFHQPSQSIPVTSQSAVKSNKQNAIFTSSILVAGGVMGASVIIGLLLTNSPQPPTYKQATSSLLTKPQIEDTSSLPSANKSSQVASSESAIINSANLPNYFHFIADSTFPNLQTAVEQIKTLQVAGYGQPGVFWIPDYPNLSNQRSFVVYVGTFSDRTSCLNFLKTYGKVNPGAYCGFASKDPHAPSDKIYFQQLQ